MNHTRILSRGLLVAALVAMATSLFAYVEPEDTALRAKSFRHADLYIGNVYQSAASLPQRANDDLAALGVDASGAYLDLRSDRWGTLMMAHPLLPGDGVGNRLTWAEKAMTAPSSAAERRDLAWQAFTDYLKQRENLLGIDINELTHPGNVTVHRGGDLIQIHAPRTYGGIVVRDSYVKATISHGNLILLGARNWGKLNLATAPVISNDAAVQVISNHLGELAADAHWPKSSLEIVPLAQGANFAAVDRGQGYSYRLAWVLRPEFSQDSIGDWEALIDAHSGQLIAMEDKAQYASNRSVVGGVYPISNDGVAPDGVEVTLPMPFADITNDGTTYFADRGGNLQACVDGDITTTLSGPYLNMVDMCGEISETTSGDILDLGSSGGIDCTVPTGASPGVTHAARSGFYELNRSIEWGRSHLPDNTWLQQPLTATMNINNTCNATGGAGGVNFYRSGGGCSNTGELAGVFVHEWGHGMDASDATPGFANPAEGIADVYSSLRLNTSCMGRNFRLGNNCGGYGDPCTSCDGVRDIDWANRASGNPHGISGPTGIDTLCGSGGGSPCGGSAHCEGAVFAESVWDLWNRDLQTEYGMSLDTAREVATRLNFIGSGAVSAFYQCSGGTGVGDGCNADSGYLQFLAADDNNGTLADGTPHMEAIFAAYDRHEIACPTPAVQTAPCSGTPATAPVVSATPLDRGVELSWAALPGADRYRIFRTEGVFGCDFGKILVGETTGTSFTDTSLRNGQEHYYIVTGMGDGDTCYGPASSCTTVTPVAGGNLAIDLASSGAVTFVDDDGDAFLDNCERATVTVGVSNIGSGSQTNVRIVDVRPISHPSIAITSPLPLTVDASMTACELSSVEVAFRAEGLGLGEIVEFEVDVTSNQLSPSIRTQTVRLAVASTEGDFQSFATGTFSFEADLENWQVVEGTFNRTGGTGGDGTTFSLDSSNAQDNVCDRARTPVVSLSASSTLSMWNNYDIEPFSASTWYDRANVGIIGADGARTLITPDGGRLYNADSAGPGNYSGCNEPEEGWAGLDATWASSSWSAAALQSAAFAGDLIHLEVIYGTDGAAANRGFWFDQVTLTDFDLQVEDTQGDVCPALTDIFSDDFESGDTSAWTSTNNP